MDIFGHVSLHAQHGTTMASLGVIDPATHIALAAKTGKALERRETESQKTEALREALQRLNVKEYSEPNNMERSMAFAKGAERSASMPMRFAKRQVQNIRQADRVRNTPFPCLH
jgi:hypothetical protein